MKIKDLHDNFETRVGIQGVGVFLKSPVKKGEVLFKLEGDIIDHPTRTSVQIGEHLHIEDKLAGHLNHHCTPNARVNRQTREFISLRDMKAGEEMMFDYNQNEDSLASPFECVCCGKRIAGKMSVEV